MADITKKIIATEQDRLLLLEEIKNMPLDRVKYVQYGNAPRTLLQNDHFHAICSDFSKQKEFAGEKRSTTGWKCLLVSGHAIAKDQNDCPVFQGLENELVVIRESTAEMTVSRKASLIEYSIAYALNNGVKLTAPKWRQEAFR